MSSISISSRLNGPPFFIVGSGRCGTTLLRRLIIERSETVIPPENYTIHHTHRLAQASRDWKTFTDQLVDLLTGQNNWHLFHINPDVLRCAANELPEDERTASGFWNLFHSLYALEVGRGPVRRWGDKTPLNTFSMDEISASFPGVRFILLIRDVYDFTASYILMEGREGQVAEAARRWIKANTQALAFASQHPDAVAILRYEDLAAQPEAALKLVGDFLDIDLSKQATSLGKEIADVRQTAHLTNALKPVNTDSVGKGRMELNDEAIETVTTIAGPLQQRFGYTLIK